MTGNDGGARIGGASGDAIEPHGSGNSGGDERGDVGGEDPPAAEPEPLSVLVVEDSEDDLLLVLRMIRQGGFAPSWARVQSAEAMREALAERTFDIIIADHSMPGFTGMEALEISQSYDPGLPFLLVSGTVGEHVAVEAMRAGARDYLMKSHLARLAPAIRRELAEVADRQERRRLTEELRQARRWRRSAGSPAASRTTSTTCSP